MSARTRRINIKTVVMIALCLCLVACAVGGVYAYLSAKTDPVSNEFIPANVSCLVEEEFNDGVKRDVKVRNTGNIDAFIRATVIATFVSDDGKVLATAPLEGTDYVVDWAADGWQKGTDGYWYHAKAVKPNETTGLLVNSIQSASAPSGYRLHVQILATGIQAAPLNVVQEAWGVSVSNGEILH